MEAFHLVRASRVFPRQLIKVTAGQYLYTINDVTYHIIKSMSLVGKPWKLYRYDAFEPELLASFDSRKDCISCVEACF